MSKVVVDEVYIVKVVNGYIGLGVVFCGSDGFE